MRRHLSSDELMDLADGTRTPGSAPHLDACEACQRQLAELLAAASAAREFEVPDPSPLFWDHLSLRVREAVREEGAPGRGSWPGSWLGSWARIACPLAAGAVAVILLAVMIPGRSRSPQAPIGSAAPAAPSIQADALSPDPSLTLVADLTAELDFDGARDAGLMSDGSVDHAVTHLSQAELLQLQRLLQMELGRPSA